jgi:hypothetical protein
MSRHRRAPNPNVLLELGYARSALGQNRIALVMNTAFGGPEKLRFDLKMYRVMTYRIALFQFGAARRFMEIPVKRYAVQGQEHVVRYPAIATQCCPPDSEAKKPETSSERSLQPFGDGTKSPETVARAIQKVRSRLDHRCKHSPEPNRAAITAG